MIKRTIFILALVAFLVCLAQPAGAQMQSSTYRIPTSVLSGGGAPMSSDNYQTNSTLGQPSPLAQGDQNPYSDNYDLYPGFWYTIETAAVNLCECDLNNDGRCDMQDWLIFGEDWGRTDCHDTGVECECDLNDDGRCDMQDWLLFGEDWGRTDCLQ